MSRYKEWVKRNRWANFFPVPIALHNSVWSFVGGDWGEGIAWFVAAMYAFIAALHFIVCENSDSRGEPETGREQ